MADGSAEIHNAAEYAESVGHFTGTGGFENNADLHWHTASPSLGSCLGESGSGGRTWRDSTAGFGPDIGVVQKLAISLPGGALSKPGQEYESRLWQAWPVTSSSNTPARNLGMEEDVYKKKATIPD
ncbi:hypothetical protein PG994_004555 [Apiospora phragmitis]|uniref:Uncharacterized protein n=1 Tax=Apiospora phragmitis TaxID=2905665 RepID=A0ABR1VTK3_9PEZI